MRLFTHEGGAVVRSGHGMHQVCDPAPETAAEPEISTWEWFVNEAAWVINFAGRCALAAALSGLAVGVAVRVYHLF